MPNRRYHIHIACVTTDQLFVLDEIALFFENHAFLTQDLNTKHTDSSNYSRRCIDVCDYVIILTGDSYGEPNNTGISQLHLSYINAKTKNKPMLILVKSHPNPTNIPRQLNDFIQLLEQQNSGFIHYYDQDTNLSELLNYAYDEMKERFIGIGWVKVNETLEPKQTKSKFTSQIPEIVEPILLDFDIDDIVFLNYTAHAYEDGNLTEVSLTAPFAWYEILQSLVNVTAFSSYGLHRYLNDLVVKHAPKAVKKLIPNAHAVSRCQVLQADALSVQKQMIDANLIQLISSEYNNNNRSTRELWHITEHAKKLLAEH